EEILSERDLRHVKLLYGIGGLSYGNASSRRTADGEFGPEDWMSASGGGKSALIDVGKHILLVKGFDAERDTMILSVPPHAKAEPGVGRRHRALDDLQRASRGRRHSPRARVDGGHRVDGDQLPVRHGGARERRRPTRPTGARSRPRRRRAA